jgi:hypothetical protein
VLVSLEFATELRRRGCVLYDILQLISLVGVCMGLDSIGFLVMDAYKRYDIASLPGVTVGAFTVKEQASSSLSILS